MTELAIPKLSLVLLIGASGSGKSTFAARHFLPTEVISSDICRAFVSDDENDQSATVDAFQVLEFIAGKRLSAGRLTVIDATNVTPQARASLIALARAHDVLPVAIVLDVPVSTSVARNATRDDRTFGAEVVKRQHDQLRRSLKSLRREGFRTIHTLSSVEDIDKASIVREKLFNDRSDLRGPFDVIGDVHGCRLELEELLATLGYKIECDDTGHPIDAAHPDERLAVFVGDLVDRGPDSVGVLRLVMGMVKAGHALCVAGNHEAKLVRALDGKQVSLSHGLDSTMAQLSQEPSEFSREVRAFADSLVAHYVLDDGSLVVAHAGLKESYHGRASGRVRAFALYGDTSGETDEFGLPVRYPWAQEYRGKAIVLYGHTPVPEPQWVNNTLCLDTGCVFGGALSALRYPEREIVTVGAYNTYYQPVRPLAPVTRDPELLRLDDVLGPRIIETKNMGRVSLRAPNAAGALEVMSRFAIDPKELLYLPPTMSPCDISALDEYLEYPVEAFNHYAKTGVNTVICEEKHMGSRAVLLVRSDGTGRIHTRTGRPFFDADTEKEVLNKTAKATATASIWDELGTDWLLLDAEIMPWSAKAFELIRGQYAAVGAAARTMLPTAVSLLEQASARGIKVTDLLENTTRRMHDAAAFSEVYRRYTLPVNGIDGLRIAPFQVLASHAATHEHREHLWHLAIADRLVAADATLFAPTHHHIVDVNDPSSVAAGTSWWRDLTQAGGEGMVVKPLTNLVRGPKGLVQPGIKVRGREYLRLIYGPDYTAAEHMARLRNRNLGTKRSAALREYALGLEALRRHTTGEPLWRVHECVFAVLALEAEPVDPRL